VKPAPFEYVRPRTLDEALAELARGGEDAQPLAGGQSLVPLLNMRLLRPSLLVDLNRVAGLDEIHAQDGVVRVGATVRQAALQGLPLVAEALPHVGHHGTRNRGTVGGSIAHADAAGELPLCLAALGGTVVAAGPGGRREIPADAFFVTHFTTALAPGELVVETVWPAARAGEGYAFEELALRHGDYALAMVACVARADRGRVVSLRIALGSVTDRPTLLDAPLDPREAGEAAAAACDPVGTMHASSEYRRALVPALVERAAARASRNALEAA
jgi:carbon-monoxide dehydrogenase medium subunit